MMLDPPKENRQAYLQNKTTKLVFYWVYTSKCTFIN